MCLCSCLFTITFKSKIDAYYLFWWIERQFIVGKSISRRWVAYRFGKMSRTVGSCVGKFPVGKYLSVGVVDGRNVWKNDFDVSLSLIDKALQVVGSDHLMVSGSCSFLHVPCDLDAETDGKHLGNELKTWMAYAKQKWPNLSLFVVLLMGKERMLTETCCR